MVAAQGIAVPQAQGSERRAQVEHERAALAVRYSGSPSLAPLVVDAQHPAPNLHHRPVAEAKNPPLSHVECSGGFRPHHHVPAVLVRPEEVHTTVEAQHSPVTSAQVAINAGRQVASAVADVAVGERRAGRTSTHELAVSPTRGYDDIQVARQEGRRERTSP